jgi:hypothetical protein
MDKEDGYHAVMQCTVAKDLRKKLGKSGISLQKMI